MLLSAALAAAALAGCAANAQPRTDAQADPNQAAVARGRLVAERVCAMCHSLEPASPARYGAAPPLANLRGRYTEISLQRHLEDTRETGNSAMPPLHIDSEEVADVVAYMNSLEGP